MKKMEKSATSVILETEEKGVDNDSNITPKCDEFSVRGANYYTTSSPVVIKEPVEVSCDLHFLIELTKGLGWLCFEPP